MRNSLTRVLLGSTLLVASLGAYAALKEARTPPGAATTSVYRSFDVQSYWNTPVTNAPLDPNSNGMIDYFKADSTTPYVHLAGTTSDGGWGDPIYWAKPTDPVYNVIRTGYSLPPEFKFLRIPASARAANTADSEMAIFDLEAGGVYKLHHASYNSSNNTWSAGGGSYYYLGSNGLAGELAESDDRRNRGHRGVPPAVHAVRWDEIVAGRIDHALKIALNTPSTSNVWPMLGSDGDSTDPNAIPQGARLRIKPSVDLASLNLPPAARTIATALQRYGAFVGDSSGGPTSLKVENTVMEGRGWLWNGVLAADSLKSIPLTSFEVLKLGYRPSLTSPLPEPTPNPVPEPTPTPVPEPTPNPEPAPSPGPTTGQVKVSSAADAFVRSDRPTDNYGTRQRVRAAASPTTIGLVKFNVPALSGNVSKAVLRLYAVRENSVFDVRLASTSAWSENTVSWSTAPAVGSPVAVSSPVPAVGWIELDVTSAVQGTGTYSFAVTSRAWAAAASREASDPSTAPRLVVSTN